jgi:hypothetical protein
VFCLQLLPCNNDVPLRFGCGVKDGVNFAHTVTGKVPGIRRGFDGMLKVNSQTHFSVTL